MTGDDLPASPPPNEDRRRGRQLKGLMLVVFGWGAVIALGAALFGRDPVSGQATFSPHPLRGAIVLGCVSLFVFIWWVAARQHRRATKR